MDEGRGLKRGGIIDSIFPPKYDFQGMVRDQADMAKEGVRALVDWLKDGSMSSPDTLISIEQKADDARHLMEEKLMEAFSTPFDRQDIYSLARQIDYILNYSLSTAQEMRAFELPPDGAIMGMAMALQYGTASVAEAVRIVGTETSHVDRMVKEMRRAEREIEAIYIESMSSVFNNDDPILAMKKREVYHHLKDAGRTLSVTIDVLHRIVVGIA
ncbi:DUF47 domain-containing protein [Methanomassiliicoccus luminyensis]|jgi:hypothetical protein|uniref:DUF47 domain-containing protein n=1 Tax=Methanomassiliicoccus luminyensis TaxID=1080712 RepID=UPI0003805C9C|nr:DUF47 family protein [Methanomassiliicoccus luminyensis]